MTLFGESVTDIDKQKRIFVITCIVIAFLAIVGVILFSVQIYYRHKLLNAASAANAANIEMENL